MRRCRLESVRTFAAALLALLGTLECLGGRASAYSCPGFCSYRGFCLKQGVCQCPAGWSGPDCSIGTLSILPR